MAMATDALTVDVWYEITNLDDDTFVYLQTDSADDCVLAFDVAEPPAASEIGMLLFEGFNSIPIPAGKSAWLKLLAGTMNVTYSQFDGILMDVAKCGFGYSSGSFVATDFDYLAGVDVQAGQDDASVRDEDNPYTFLGYLTTAAANIAASVTIDSATLSLSLSDFLPGETIRVYGTASTSSVYGSLADWSDIDGLSVTTAYTDLVVGSTGRERVDVAAILQEQVDTGGWGTTSPLQFILKPQSPTADADGRIVVVRSDRQTNVVVEYS